MSRNVNAISWSPDGEYLAMVRTFLPTGDSWGDSELWLWESGNGRIERVLERFDNHPIDAVAWAPDGHVIGYGGTILAAGTSDLGTDFVPIGSYIRAYDLDSDDGPLVGLDSQNPELLMAGGPAWSPDGRSMAWVLDGAITVVNADISSPRTLPLVSNDDLGTGWAFDQVIWSPDSKQILSGQVDGPTIDNDFQSALVLYNVDTAGQPELIEDWNTGHLGRVSWDGGSQ